MSQLEQLVQSRLTVKRAETERLAPIGGIHYLKACGAVEALRWVLAEIADDPDRGRLEEVEAELRACHQMHEEAEDTVVAMAAKLRDAGVLVDELRNVVGR